MKPSWVMSSILLIVMSIKYMPVVEYQALLRSFVTVLLRFLLCILLACLVVLQRRKWLLRCVRVAIASLFHQADLITILQF